MDYFEFDNVKKEKTNAMRRYNRLRKIANLFRCVEVFLALLFLSWLSTHLPSVFQLSGKYLKKLCVLLVSPRFVFLIGNAIIITLFVKSGKSPPESKQEPNLYEEFVKNSENRHKIFTETEIVFHDKQTVVEEPIVHRDAPPRSPRQKKSYQRSKSEYIKREIAEMPHKDLKRSETDKCREAEKSVAQEMSNEEFQRRIDAFLAKNMMFHWEESMAIVVQNQSSS